MNGTHSVGQTRLFLSVLCIGSAGSAFGQSETAESEPLGSNCCTAHGGGGCDDPICSTEVCCFDFKCCFTWDSICAGLAGDLCGNLCGGGGCPGTGDCCTAHAAPGCSDTTCCDLVCASNSACCSSQWSAACADLAVDICDVCEPPIVCPQEGDCCNFNFTPGCSREECCNIVCIELGDEFCCRGEWDDVCARKARDNCPNICICDQFGDMNEDGAVDLSDVAGFQNCFTGRGGSIEDACACADYDADDDVDLADYKVVHELLAP